MKKLLILPILLFIGCTEMVVQEAERQAKVAQIGEDQTPMSLYISQGRTVYQQQVLESTVAVEDSILRFDYTGVIDREGLAPSEINRDYWVTYEEDEDVKNVTEITFTQQ